MTFVSSSPRERPGEPHRGSSVSARFRRGLLAGLILAVFALAYGGTLTLVLHQAAFATSPGDRLVVAFPPGTDTPTVLERLGAAGAVHYGRAGIPGFHQAEIVDARAVEQLSRDAWVLRFPGRPALESCFGVSVSADQRGGS